MMEAARRSLAARKGQAPEIQAVLTRIAGKWLADAAASGEERAAAPALTAGRGRR